MDTCRKRHNTKSLGKLPFVEFIMVQKVLTDLLIAPASFNKLPYMVIVGMNV